MSEPILAPEEIDALMAEVAPSEQADAIFASMPPMPQPAQVEHFSFETTDEDSPERYPMFVNLQERLVEILDEQWDEVFKRDITVQVAHLESSIYKKLITVDHPQVYFVFDVEEHGRMMITFDTAMIVAYVDAMLSGEGESTGHPEVLSPVEMRLSERIALKLSHTLTALWKPVYPLEFKVYKIDHDPQFLAMTGALEKCFSAYFDIKLDDDLSYQMGVHYPHTFLEPLLDILRVAVTDEETSADNEWSDNLMQQLSKTSADVCFEMGRCQMDIGAFLALKPGEFLPLTIRASEPCSIWVEDIPMFKARAGEKDGDLAAEILDPITNGGQS